MVPDRVLIVSARSETSNASVRLPPSVFGPVINSTTRTLTAPIAPSIDTRRRRLAMFKTNNPNNNANVPYEMYRPAPATRPSSGLSPWEPTTLDTTSLPTGKLLSPIWKPKAPSTAWPSADITRHTTRYPPFSSSGIATRTQSSPSPRPRFAVTTRSPSESKTRIQPRAVSTGSSKFSEIEFGAFERTELAAGSVDSITA